MCRWVAYQGAPLLLEDLLIRPVHSMIDQSLSARSSLTPTNGDGFGLGWYDGQPRPGVFRSVQPAWNNMNFRDLAAHIESRLFIAHVRATTTGRVQETNCHPFRHDRWLFVHNGAIQEFEAIRRELMLAVSPDLFGGIVGTTDSEVMFNLALTLGLEDDPIGAVERMAGLVEDVARARGIADPLVMSLGLSDGDRLFAVRYATKEADAPTLFHSRDASELYDLNPELRGRVSPDARAVASEPLGGRAAAWVQIQSGSAIVVEGGEVKCQGFRPRR